MNGARRTAARTPEADPAGQAGVQPVFIFSITRSGSTLVQRVLGGYPEIATASEPWLLIPQLYAFRRQGVVAEYTHYLAVDAIEDFCKQLPRGVDTYLEELRRFMSRLYAQAGDEARPRYFLDKSPPYFFIAEDVMRLFPDGKFIFLWRNPLAVVSSLIEWDEGRWNPARYRENLFDGIARLASAWQRHGEGACAVRYEDLISGGEEHWRRLTDYLELDFEPQSLSRFAGVKLNGRMGDPFGPERYTSVSSEPLTKWRRRLNNPLRKAWSARYLRWIGSERLAVMGYDLDELLDELASVPSTTEQLGGDLRRTASALVKEPIRARARRSLGVGGPSSFRHVLGPPSGGRRGREDD